MSSILKALKKLEEEKTARTPDDLKIDTEILRGGSSSRFPYKNFALLAVLFFVCGSALTYLYVKQGTHVGNLPLRTAQRPSAATEEFHMTTPAEDESSPTKHSEPSHSRASNAPASAPNAKHPKHSRATAPVMSGKPNQGTEATPAAPAAAAPVKHIPVLRVEGIAYHFGSADSLAVVNGTTVYAGAIVEGVKVEEIGKDRIRFNYEGEKFDVPLGKSN